MWNLIFNAETAQKRRAAAGALAAVVVAASAIQLPAASHATEPPTSREATALSDLGLLRSQDAALADTSGLGYLDSTAGLVLPFGEGAGSLFMKPALDVTPTTDSTGLLLYAGAGDYTSALSGPSTGASAGYSIIFSKNAPTDYSYELSGTDIDELTLEINDGGGIDIFNEGGELVNVVLPAWALDAEGTSLPTTYSVDGDILTQHVDHTNAVYPVVADPSFGCDSLWCTVVMTRGENAAVADNALNIGLVCGPTGPFVAACTALVALIWAKANEARNAGKCAGVRWWRINGALMHPVIERCA